MTAYGTVETAVEAMREGAYDFITKPLRRTQVVRVVQKALEKRSLVEENRTLRAQLEASRHRLIVGQSLTLRRTVDIIEHAAASAATVLLLGESGTGKELMARLLHERSPRAGRPFVAVNCAAIPDGILEGELFGYEKGAFTGAVMRRDGRFAQAHQGTLFLDEIGEIPLTTQVKLLRVLQEGEVERLGGKSEKIDVRVVAASNRDLKRAVADGSFREDLYYRLHVIAVELPPLRDRSDDVPLLANHFVRRFSEKNSRAIAGISKEALDRLVSYPWPGNVRELENAMERAVVLSRDSTIEIKDLPSEVQEGGVGESMHRPSGRLSFEIGTPLSVIERRVITETLRHTRGDKRLAAELLGIATRTIYRKLDESDTSEPS